jgi:zinc protease
MVWSHALALLLAAAAAGWADEPAPATLTTPAASSAAVKIPSAQEVLARFVKEIGGQGAFDKIQSQHLTGKFEMGAQGMNGALEVFAKRPDKLLIKITLPGMGEMLQGYDGKVGWAANPITGPMLLEGKMLDQLKEQASFDAVLHDAARFRATQNAGEAEFDGKKCYKLKLVKESGEDSTEYYEIQSGLLVGSSEVQETPLGAVPVTAVISDYRKFGEIRFATRLTEKTGPLTQVMSFDTMEINNVEDAVFALPDSIKGLLKK